jgi:hydrogenase maturation protease
MTPATAPAAAHERTGLLILGLGNLLCTDDGAGVRVVAALAAGYRLPAGVRALDGGTLGLQLLGELADADTVLLVDAVRADGPPGTLVALDHDEVAPAVRERLSVHQVGVADLLDGLELIGSKPRALRLLGVVPASFELGVGCTPSVERALPALLERVVAEARDLGFALQPRAPSSASLPADGLAGVGLPGEALPGDLLGDSDATERSLGARDTGGRRALLGL